MGTTGGVLQTFVADLEAEISEQRLSLTDAEFLSAVEAGTATRDQIGEWAKAFYATTRNGRLMIGTFYANSPDDMTEAIELIRTGRVKVNRIITHRLPLAETGKGFEMMTEAGKSLKIIIEPQK